MADFSELKAAIRQDIKDNTSQDITGDILQAALLRMVDDINAAKEDAPATPGTQGQVLTVGGDGVEWKTPDHPIIIATYGVTSGADLLAAYNAGKGVVLLSGGNLYQMSKIYISSGEFAGAIFSCIIDTKTFVINVAADGTWGSNTTYNFELNANKVTAISAASTDTQYPSAKCLYDNLLNYYLKSETYTRQEVNDLIGAISQFTYEAVSVLPTASYGTMRKIYLVPSSDPQSQNIKDEYITIDNGVEANPRYTWELIGSTAIDLSGYQTTANLATQWGLTPSDTKYPSEKLVYDALYKRGVISQTQTWEQASDGGYDYVMSNKVVGNIPKSFVDLWKARGGETADFDEDTGYFEYLDLVDISYEEAKKIYTTGVGTFGNAMFANSELPRAVLPQLGTGGLNGSKDLYAAFLRCKTVESFTFKPLYSAANNAITIATNVATLLYDDNKLKSVGGVLKLQTTSGGGEIANNAFSLVNVSFSGLKMNISFANSARLSVASILYMINNEASTSPITITLHPTAYTRAMADASVTAALAAHTNVTLASA